MNFIIFCNAGGCPPPFLLEREAPESYRTLLKYGKQGLGLCLSSSSGITATEDPCKHSEPLRIPCAFSLENIFPFKLALL